MVCYISDSGQVADLADECERGLMDTLLNMRECRQLFPGVEVTAGEAGGTLWLPAFQ